MGRHRLRSDAKHFDYERIEPPVSSIPPCVHLKFVITSAIGLLRVLFVQKKSTPCLQQLDALLYGLVY